MSPQTNYLDVPPLEAEKPILPSRPLWGYSHMWQTSSTAAAAELTKPDSPVFTEWKSQKKISFF